MGTIPCIAIFTAGEPHPKEKICKFINFEDDGYKVSPHIGLLETESAKDKRQHLLDVWFDRIEAENKFCVKSTITAEEEWLHSFYYFNDEIPSEKSFDKVVGDYLSFEFSMIMQGRKYLFEGTNKQVAKYNEIAKLEEKEWRAFPIDSIFKIESGCDIYDKERIEGKIPYITSSAENNGIKYFVSNMNSTYESNVIAVNRNGSVGYAFYHKYPALFSNDCRKLKILHCPRDNEAVSLFMTTQIMQQKEKYNYSLKMGTNRLSRQKIMLPIDDKGNPDYPYMEQYIKNIFYKKAKEYLDFKEK